MVNMVTGDFTYSLPVLDIPGSEGSFSLPLSYHAGIGLDQQATWCGLGFNINPGTITRSINQFPDDANGEQIRTTVNYELTKGWRTSGLGIVPMGWDSEKGHYGKVDLLGLASVSWENGLKGGDLVGVTIENGKVGVDAVRMGMAALTIATLGTSTAAKGTSELAKFAATTGGKLAINAGTSMAISGAFSLAMGDQSSSGFNQVTHEVERHLFYTNYWNYIKKNARENMYGSLYFHNLPTKNSGLNETYHLRIQKGDNGSVSTHSQVAQSYFHDALLPTGQALPGGNVIVEEVSDVSMVLDPEEDYPFSQKPLSIAHDYFSVMGGGTSGAIKPYRLETPSVAVRRQDKIHDKYMIAPAENYKVGFRYEGGISNYYDYHKGNTPDGNSSTLGMSYQGNLNQIKLTDRTLFENRTETESAARGIVNKRLVQGKHVEWYSNTEIAAPYPHSPMDQGKFLEFQTQQPSATSRSAFRESKPASGIGGFVVTTEDGTTYHYALPVYNLNQYSKTWDKDDPSGKYSEQTQNNPYATSWLLTAVVGSDYIDREPLGTVGPEDWGSWVKLEYGKFASSYRWRTPYEGYSYGSTDIDKKSPSYTEGRKETYYLNRISTRTHTALFIKDVRLDGRGYYERNGSTKPSSSLKLNEIILLANEDYQKLTTPEGIGTGIPALSDNTASNAATYDGQVLRNGDSFAQVLDVYDVEANTAIRSYLTEKALKRVVFHYTYELCQVTPNSFESAVYPPVWAANTNGNLTERFSGKLTLKQLSIYGSKNSKTAPDYVFGYGFNPLYNVNHWDDFGMYNSRGTDAVTSHRASAAIPTDATAWSLTTITSPLGSTTEVGYERDAYNSVSGMNIQNDILRMQDADTDGVLTGASVPATIQVGDQVQVTYVLAMKQCCNSLGEDCYNERTEYKTDLYTITQIGNSSITLDHPPTNLYSTEVECGTTDVAYVYLTFPKTFVGGNLRVKELQVKDGATQAYKTRYLYGQNESQSMSSGVISKMPDYYAAVDRNRGEFEAVYRKIDNLEDMPETPVMYGKVTVLNGRLNTDSDYTVKTEYEFVTPHVSMIQEEHTRKIDRASIALPDVNPSWADDVLSARSYIQLNTKADIHTAQIGQVKSVRQYTSRGMLAQETEFAYGEQVPGTTTPQGVFTEGVLTAELVSNALYVPGLISEFAFYRFNRTTKQYHPSVLTSRRVIAGGTTVQQDYQKFDFYTGQVLQSQYTDALKHVYQSVTVPAYHKYPEMGPKGLAAGNRNMLAQTTASYVYKVDGATRKPVAVGVQTWKPDKTAYRNWNANAARYESQPTSTTVWRKDASWTWDGRALNPDGTLKDFTDFDWQASTQPGYWLKTGEVVLYDKYSMPLSSRDMNGNYASQKLDATQRYVLAACSGARYTEMAYSGAEDRVAVGSQWHFGGEVLGAEHQDATYAHTGKYSVKLPAGQHGFTYTATIGDDATTTTELGSNRTYRLSAWIHKTDVATHGAKLYAQIGGTIAAQAGLDDPDTKRSGDWYLVNLLVDIPASANGQTLTVGVRNTGVGTVWVDDFRFHPLDAPLTANVYDAKGQVIYTLDNDNIYTRYEYNDIGQVWRNYQQRLGNTGTSPTGASEQLVSETNIHYRRGK